MAAAAAARWAPPRWAGPLGRCGPRAWRAPGELHGGRLWLLQRCGAAAGSASGQPQHLWDITPERWVDIKYQEEDLARFPAERAAFRADRRLQPGALAPHPTQGRIDTLMALRGLVSSLRIFGDCYAIAFEELIFERMAEQPSLMERFRIPLIEDKSVVQELHSKAVPGEGDYFRVRMQAYWLAVHVWLLHNKQHALQESEGVYGSALCALLTRRLFEFQWNRIRGLLHAADVPVMSVTNELQDLQEFIFGFCVALDDVFREEVGPQGEDAVARALAAEDSALGAGRFGLAPRVKYTLWANVYSGQPQHDAEHLYELTVYLLRQKMALDKLTREPFFSCNFTWADHGA